MHAQHKGHIDPARRVRTAHYICLTRISRTNRLYNTYDYTQFLPAHKLFRHADTYHVSHTQIPMSSMSHPPSVLPNNAVINIRCENLRNICICINCMFNNHTSPQSLCDCIAGTCVILISGRVSPRLPRCRHNNRTNFRR